MGTEIHFTPAYAKAYGRSELTHGESICACCGAYCHDKEKPVAKKHGPYNQEDFINVIAGEFENTENDKFTVKTVQTQNGPITVGYRHAW